MSRGQSSLAVFCSVLSLAACQPAPTPPAEGGQAPDSVNLLLAAASVALPRGTTPAMLPAPGSDGARLVTQYCTLCHGLSAPSSHSATDWPIVLRRMWLRMDLLDSAYHVPIPTQAERVIMLRYMLDNALRVTDGPLPSGPGQESFVRTCGQCHDLPDPRQHSPEDWVSVVTRMGQRMETILQRRPAGPELQQIILYLEGASRRR